MTNEQLFLVIMTIGLILIAAVITGIIDTVKTVKHLNKQDIYTTDEKVNQ